MATIQIWLNTDHTKNMQPKITSKNLITSLSFSPPHLSFPRNLISAAAADDSVSIFDAYLFVLLKSLRPHMKAITVNNQSLGFDLTN